MRCQLHLLKFQIDGLVYPIDELIDRGIDRRQNGRLFIDFELKLLKQVLVERVLGRLHLIEQLHDLLLASVCGLILLLGLLNDFVS